MLKSALILVSLGAAVVAGLFDAARRTTPDQIQLPRPAQADSSRVAADPDFPHVIEATVDGTPQRLKLTGTATRKKVGIEFYRIAGYCHVEASPADVDALIAADCPKQLILVMQRDISERVLQRGFQLAFEANDPEDRYATEIKDLLAQMGPRRLVKGDRVTLTHLPQSGVECRLGDDAPWTLRDPQFAKIVWKVFMGPRPVTPEVRQGLGSLLSDAPQVAADERPLTR